MFRFFLELILRHKKVFFCVRTSAWLGAGAAVSPFVLLGGGGTGRRDRVQPSVVAYRSAQAAGRLNTPPVTEATTAPACALHRQRGGGQTGHAGHTGETEHTYLAGHNTVEKCRLAMTADSGRRACS